MPLGFNRPRINLHVSFLKPEESHILNRFHFYYGIKSDSLYKCEFLTHSIYFYWPESGSLTEFWLESRIKGYSLWNWLSNYKSYPKDGTILAERNNFSGWRADLRDLRYFRKVVQFHWIASKWNIHLVSCLYFLE